MRVTGDKELVLALRALGRGLPGSSIDGAMKSAANPMLTDVISRARKHRQPGRAPKGGHIDQNIKFFRRKQSSKRRRDYVLGATGKRKSILTWLEYGTRAHFQPRRFGGIMHPGARRFPILRPAYDGHHEEVPERFGREIWKHIALMAVALNKGRK